MKALMQICYLIFCIFVGYLMSSQYQIISQLKDINSKLGVHYEQHTRTDSNY